MLPPNDRYFDVPMWLLVQAFWTLFVGGAEMLATGATECACTGRHACAGLAAAVAVAAYDYRRASSPRAAERLRGVAIGLLAILVITTAAVNISSATCLVPGNALGICFATTLSAIVVAAIVDRGPLLLVIQPRRRERAPAAPRTQPARACSPRRRQKSPAVRE